MNIKIGDLLFEEKDSDKIHKVFESNLREASEDDSENSDEIDMTKIELEKLGPILAKKIKALLPDKESILELIKQQNVKEKEVPQNIKAGLKRLQGRDLGGGVSINIFNIFPSKKGEKALATPRDIEEYENLGAIVLEVIKRGKTISGENSQGKNIREFFAMPFPGWTTTDEELIKLHSLLWGLELKKVDPEDFKGEPMLALAGLDKKFHLFPVVEKDDTGSEIKKLRTALKAGKIGEFKRFLDASKRGDAISKRSDLSGSNSSQGDGVTESYVHNNKLSDLLFEKKSLSKLNTNDKKKIVESFFNVNYTELNNFEKRDYYNLSTALLKEDLLLEKINFSLDKLKKMPREKINDLLKNAKSPKFIEKIKQQLASFKKDDKEENQSDEDSTVSQVDVSSPEAEAVVLDSEATEYIEPEFTDREDEKYSDFDEDKDDKESGVDEDEDDASKSSSSGISSQTGKKVLAGAIKEAGDYGQYMKSRSALDKFIDDEISDYNKFVNSLPSFKEKLQEALSKKDNADDEDKELASEIANQLDDATVKFKSVMANYISEFKALRSTEDYFSDESRNKIRTKLQQNRTGDADNSKLEDVVDYLVIGLHSDFVKQVICVSHTIRIAIATYVQLNNPSDDMIKQINIAQAEQSGSPSAEAEARLLNALMKLGVSLEDVKDMVGSNESNESLAKSLKLLNPEYSSKDILFEDAARKSILKLSGKVVRKDDGSVDAQALKFFYESLKDNGSYKKVRDEFVKRFTDHTGKTLKNASKDQIADSIPDFFESISGSPSSNTPLSVGKQKSSAREIIRKISRGTGSVLKTILVSIPKILLMTLGAGALYGGYKLVTFITSDPANIKGQIVAWLGATSWEDAGTKIIEFCSDFMSNPGLQLSALFKNITGITVDKIGEVITNIKDWFGNLGDSATVSAIWGWVEAPWAAYTSGGIGSALLAGFPLTVSLLAIAAAPILLLGAGVGFLTGSIASYFGWTTTANILTGISSKLFVLAGDFVTRLITGGIGIGDVVLIGGMLFYYFKKRKAVQFEEKVGEVFRLYVTSQAAGITLQEASRLIGMDFTKMSVEFIRELKPSGDEITKIIKDLTGFDYPKSVRPTLDEIEKFIEKLEDYVKKAGGKSGSIKFSTLRIIKETLRSLQEDYIACKGGLIDEEDFIEHYASHTPIKIIVSALRQNRNHTTISAVNENIIVDSKDELIEALTKTRNNQMQSLKKLGTFKVSDDPIDDLIKQIESSDKKSKMTGKVNVSAIVENFLSNDKIKESDIDFDSLFSHLSQARANITASDLKRFQSTSKLDSKKFKQKPADYYAEFFDTIKENLGSGLELLVDKSVLNESTKNRSNLLLEYKNHAMISRLTRDYEKQLLNEASLKGMLSTAATGILLTKLAATAATVTAGFTGATISGIPYVGGFVAAMASPTATALIIGALAFKAGTMLYGLMKKKLYKGNIDPYKDKDFLEVLKPALLGCIKARVAFSYVETILTYKNHLEKIGIKVVGEDSQIFSDYKKKLDNKAQVRELKANMNDDAKSLHTSIREIVYYAKRKNMKGTKQGLGYFMTDAHLNEYIDSVCFKKGAPLEELFKALQNQKETNEGFVYQQGLGLLLNEASGNKKVSLSVSEIYDKFEKQTHDFLYKNTDFNGEVSKAIIEILEPNMKVLGNIFSQQRNTKLPFLPEFGPFRNKRDQFFRDTISDAAWTVTGIPKDKFLKILYSDKAKERETQISKQKRKIKPESFVHTAGLGILLERNILLEDRAYYVDDYKVGFDETRQDAIDRYESARDTLKTELEEYERDPSNYRYDENDKGIESAKALLKDYGDHYTAISKGSIKVHEEDFGDFDKANANFKAWQEGEGKALVDAVLKSDSGAYSLSDGKLSLEDPDAVAGGGGLKMASSPSSDSSGDSTGEAAAKSAEGAEGAEKSAGDTSGESSDAVPDKSALAKAADSDVKEAFEGKEVITQEQICTEKPLSFDQVKSLMANESLVNKTSFDDVYGIYKVDDNYVQIYYSNLNGGTWSYLKIDENGEKINSLRIDHDNLDKISSELQSAKSLDINGKTANQIYDSTQFKRIANSVKGDFPSESIPDTPDMDKAQTIKLDDDIDTENYSYYAKTDTGGEDIWSPKSNHSDIQDAIKDSNVEIVKLKKFTPSETTPGGAETYTRVETEGIAGYNPRPVQNVQKLCAANEGDHEIAAEMSSPDDPNLTDPINDNPVVESNDLFDRSDVFDGDITNSSIEKEYSDELTYPDDSEYDPKYETDGEVYVDGRPKPPEPEPDPDSPDPKPDSPDPKPDSPDPKPDSPEPDPDFVGPPNIGDGTFGDMDIDWDWLKSETAFVLLGVKILDILAAAPMEQSKVIPLIMGIDWARIPSTNLSVGISSYLVKNKKTLLENNIELVGNLPPEVSNKPQELSKDFGDDPALSGDLAVLSKAAASRLQKELVSGMSKRKAKKFKITAKDIENALKKDLRKTVYAYHKAYNTDVYQRIEDNVNANFTKSKIKGARDTVGRKTAIGLAGLTTGAGLFLTSTGFGSALGIPLMIAGGSVYSNRAGTFEDDQLVGGDEREAELQKQISKVTDSDVTALTRVIIDISKDAKGIQDSFKIHGNILNEFASGFIHRNALASLLFEDQDLTKTSSGYPVQKVKDFLKAKSVMCYDGTLTPGSEIFEKAEEFTLNTVCSILRSMCDITVTGVEKYRQPKAVAAKAETFAQASINHEAPVGKPASPSLAAVTADAPAPQMNQPITPQQFAAVLNNSGGENAKVFTRFMMYHMLLKQTNGDSKRSLQQLNDFLAAMGEGKVTTREAIDKASEMIDSAPEEVKTSAAATKADGSDATTSTTKDTLASALEESVKDLNSKLPNVRQSDMAKMFKNLLKINEIVNHTDLDGVLNLTARGRNIFPKTGRGKSITDKASLKRFADQALTGKINIVKDDQIKNYNDKQAKEISSKLYQIFFNGFEPLIEINANSISQQFSYTAGNDDLTQAISYLRSSLQFFFINKVINNAIGSKLKDDHNLWEKAQNLFSHPSSAVHDRKIMFGLGNAIKTFTNELNESRVSRKPVLDNRVRRKTKAINEDYLLGNLSNLLFEESIVVESKTGKSKEISEGNINLRREWLKIWDI